MCWNEQVSFLTFTIVIIIILIIIQQDPSDNVRWQCYFVIAFITIQLLEGFLWISIKRHNNKLNALITSFVLLALWIQPLVQCYFGYKLGTMDKVQKTILLVGSVIFGVLIIYMCFRVLRGRERFLTVTTNSCHLNWMAYPANGKMPSTRNCNSSKTFPKTKLMSSSFMSDIPLLPILYIAGLLVPLLFILPRKQGIILATVGFITLIVALYFNRKDGSFSSLWCFLAIFYVLTLIYIHIFCKEDKQTSPKGSTCTSS